MRRQARSSHQTVLFVPAAEANVVGAETKQPLVEALADLLLEAIGRRSEHTEVDDESEDHA
jgi:hypothetical protein